MKRKFVELYMNIAETVSSASYATRLKVGAVAVREHRILSIGYNGTPPGFDNNCEMWVPCNDPLSDADMVLVTRPEVIHAEQNAIYKMARDGQSALGADLFVTHAPCIECAKAIKTTGFSKVWFKQQYRNTDGVDFLLANGVTVEQV
jgi:dCMP deaminase